MSSSSWETTTLGEISEIVMGQSPLGDTCNNSGDGLPLLNGPTEFGNSHPIPLQFTTDPKKYAEPGDLLFCVRGSTTGRMNWANQRYAIGRGLAALRHKAGKDFQPFLKGLIDFYLPTLLAEATGSTFPNVSSSQLNQLEVNVPNLSTQKRIAGVLSALDEKIELNRQTNATLEAIAQAIFKEWFVHYNYPGATGELVDSEPGPIPAGWRVGDLGELLSFKNGKSSPERQDDFEYPVYGANGIIGKVETSNTNERSIVVGRVGSFCGAVYYVMQKSFVTDNAIVAKPKFNDSSLYCFVLLKNLNLNNYKVGSGQPLLNQRILSGIRVVIPPREVLATYEQITLSNFKKIHENERESQNLVHIRDTLLPKLMRGEIEV